MRTSIKFVIFFVIAYIAVFVFLPTPEGFFDYFYRPRDPHVAQSAAPTPALSDAALAGKKLFRSNCQRCHSLTQPLTGPALAGVENRVPSQAWLYDWIKNPQKMIHDGDPYAVELFNENGRTNMDAFPFLDSTAIGNILIYIREAGTAKAMPGVASSR